MSAEQQNIRYSAMRDWCEEFDQAVRDHGTDHESYKEAKDLRDEYEIEMSKIRYSSSGPEILSDKEVEQYRKTKDWTPGTDLLECLVPSSNPNPLNL